jgi:hypothetical protein
MPRRLTVLAAKAAVVAAPVLAVGGAGVRAGRTADPARSRLLGWPRLGSQREVAREDEMRVLPLE